jgi:hypothetical protein
MPFMSIRKRLFLAVALSVLASPVLAAAPAPIRRDVARSMRRSRR